MKGTIYPLPHWITLQSQILLFLFLPNSSTIRFYINITIHSQFAKDNVGIKLCTTIQQKTCRDIKEKHPLEI